MKLIMTLLVRDEEDIVRANIEYHLAQGVDFFIATDNRSVDSTASILKSFEARGLLRYIFEGDDDYSQHAWVTKMARMAFTEYGADWVINNDADEFWWPMAGSLHEALAALPPNINTVLAQRHNFVAVEQSARPFFDRMIYRNRVSLNLFGDPLPPKITHRGCASVTVGQGNHEVGGMGSMHTAESVVEILHFPIRSYAQIENKISKGGAAYERNQSLPKGFGNTWRMLFDKLKRDNDLKRYFAENHHDEMRIATRLAKGEIIEDRRLSEYFALNIPHFEHAASSSW
jgi:Glycosyl transferase family 2